MFDNYTLKVPRDVFEAEYAAHKKPIFAPDGPYITSNEIRFTYRRGGRRIRIIASLGDNDYALSEKPYMTKQIMAAFNRMVKYPKYKLSDLPDTFDVKQVMYSNPKYEGKEVPFAIAYDVRSSFGFAELGMIPDTDREYKGKIKKGDVGIRLHMDKWIFATEGHGYKCFPLIPWDAHKFVNLWYDRKENAKTPEEKQRAKDHLTHHVGMMKYHNQIIRAWIIWNSNKNIEKYKDENTILCNTDCLISAVERPDIPVGPDIGQFKIENQGRFAKVNMDYQFYDTGAIKKRGLVKDEREGFDILTTGKNNRTIPAAASGYNFIKGRFQK